jgi:NADH-quinone oxidoreductase subunit A
MTALLLLPPVAFGLVLGSVWLQSRGLDAFRLPPPAGRAHLGKRKPYACGEDVPDHKAHPDYSQFFVFAFFFTVMHVVALVVATVPRGEREAAWLAAGFLACAAVALFKLFRRN